MADCIRCYGDERTLYDTDRVQTVTHISQTGSSGFNYTHQQLTYCLL